MEANMNSADMMASGIQYFRSMNDRIQYLERELGKVNALLEKKDEALENYRVYYTTLQEFISAMPRLTNAVEPMRGLIMPSLSPNPPSIVMPNLNPNPSSNPPSIVIPRLSYGNGPRTGPILIPGNRLPLPPLTGRVLPPKNTNQLPLPPLTGPRQAVQKLTIIKPTVDVPSTVLESIETKSPVKMHNGIVSNMSKHSEYSNGFKELTKETFMGMSKKEKQSVINACLKNQKGLHPINKPGPAQKATRIIIKIMDRQNITEEEAQKVRLDYNLPMQRLNHENASKWDSEQ